MNNLPARSNKKKKTKDLPGKTSAFQRLTPDDLFSFFTANIIKDRMTFTR